MRKFLIPILLFFAALTLVLISNSRAMHTPSTPPLTLTQVSPDAWETLSQKRILFTHASVGYNMMDGIQTLQQEYPAVKLDVVHNPTPWVVEQPALTHVHWEDLDLWNKTASEPQLTLRKTDIFSDLMTNRVKGQYDIVLMKFCWADFNGDMNVDVAQSFAYYKAAMAKLAQEFPETTFVHITTPLVSEPQGTLAFKNRIKQLLGKPPFHLSDNVKINQFNDLLRAEYDGNAPLFDLAQVESTTVDGKRQTFSKDGNNYFSLVPDYTNDMGHLNGLGQRIVADHLLVFLANLE